MCLKVAAGIANIVELNQTAPAVLSGPIFRIYTNVILFYRAVPQVPTTQSVSRHCDQQQKN